MHDEHQGFFETLANKWDPAFTAEDLERLAHVEQLETQEGWDVLDLGCGTGVLFDMVRRRVGLHGSVTGVDFSLEMAEKEHAIDELHRALKDGARFYIIHRESSKEITAAHQSLGGAVKNDSAPPETMMRRMFRKGCFVDTSIEDHPGLYLAKTTNSK